MNATLPTSEQIFRASAARWRESAERWLDIARSALGNSDLHQVMGALHCVAERREWAQEDEAHADQFANSPATSRTLQGEAA